MDIRWEITDLYWRLRRRITRRLYRVTLANGMRVKVPYWHGPHDAKIKSLLIADHALRERYEATGFDPFGDQYVSAMHAIYADEEGW